MTVRIRLLEAGLLILLLSGIGYADDDGSAGDTSTVKPGYRIEVKREMTNRGTTDETTRTTLKIDSFLQGTIALLRLEIPFPDEKTDFDGSPFDPHVGDIKIRVGFRPMHVQAGALSSFFEVMFPTASPEDLGSGKYEVSPGLQASVPVSLSGRIAGSHKLSFDPLVQQVISVAGDESRMDINYTKFELSFTDIWRQRYWTKLTAKPVIDWEQDAKTGAVAELEVGWNISSDWAAWLMCGARLWGEGVPLIYGTRVQIGAARLF